MCYKLRKKSNTISYNNITDSGPVQGIHIQALGPDRLHVAWSAPSDPRGQITGYRIRHRQVGIGHCDHTVHSWSAWLTVTTMYHTIHELQPYRQYEVMVASLNGFGVGEPISIKAYATQSGTAICQSIIDAMVIIILTAQTLEFIYRNSESMIDKLACSYK